MTSSPQAQISVEKIGGTSMSAFGDVLRHIMLYDKDRIYGRIYVVSAYSGVTNQLLEHKKTGERGIYALFAEGADYHQALGGLAASLKKLNAGFADLGLPLAIAEAFVDERIAQAKKYLEAMHHVLASGYISRKDVLLAAREVLASIGESHSAFNAVEILKANDVKAILLDLAGFDDDYAWTIDERIQKSFLGLDLANNVIVATGYTKGVEGIMREFDRGYSEVTFSKIAVEVRPAEAVIHKEFHLSSADPNLVGLENAVIVGATNYDVADQLADVGMEAIHPKAAKPMELAGIPIRLKNTFEPEHPGTLITKDYVGQRARVEMVTGTDKVTLVEIHDPSMVGTVGFDYGLMEIFCKHEISYILKATNANSIAHLVWDSSVTTELVEELEARYQVVTVKKSAIVCAIGSNIGIPGVLARAAQAMAEAGVNVNCISQTLRQVNMQFVIERGDYKKAVIALNQALCVAPGTVVPKA
ncbi:aspartate kinase [Candidatus Accumulibacter phosphatis]|uniref:aspartate kinase n=1 Tax=Candidatus Accumulibacter phosphatis TaxID=327160 RepID=A0A5S4EQD6_9PROT|nr:aspartate kinase [Candidatus Accumulibacter phosphatis]TMQ77641.1 Aspartokinase [Candidatus Accumulibacter phosphatis]